MDSFVHHLVVIIKIIESNFFLKCVPYSKGQKIDLFILKLVFERYFDIFLANIIRKTDFINFYAIFNEKNIKHHKTKKSFAQNFCLKNV